MGQPILTLENIHKSFDGVKVLDGISLSVLPGQFLTLLGPSGCGKTTTLRIIAGLESPDEGRVLLSGADVTKLPPEKRAVNTVFQNYALFPHMNVQKNIASKEQIARIHAHFDALAAEMEGGAIGQVCTANGVLFAVLRAISDGVNEEAKMSYPKFVDLASQRSLAILMEFLRG